MTRSAGEERVAGDEKAVGQETETARRVAGGVQSREVKRADGNDVAVLEALVGGYGQFGGVGGMGGDWYLEGGCQFPQLSRMVQVVVGDQDERGASPLQTLQNTVCIAGGVHYDAGSGLPTGEDIRVGLIGTQGQ